MSGTLKDSICQHIGSAETTGKMAEGAIVLDVRSAIEYECERIPQSINIPLDELEKRYEEVSRGKELVVVCRSGKRAERAAYMLLGKGFKPKVLEGGLVAWRGAGCGVKEGRKMISIERQVQLAVGLVVLTGVALGVFVNRWFLLLPAFFGAGLTFAGLSGTCGLAVLLTRAPWNKLGPNTAGGSSTSKSASEKTCCS